MPGSETLDLRIYCICGQKMRVSESMFGAPGKCIACRQKIRIPRPDEIPPDTREIWLKDHPEFLRTARRPSKKRDGKKRASLPEITEERDETTFGDEKEKLSTVAIDILEPLTALASLEHKVQRRLMEVRRRIREGEPGLSGEKDRYKDIRARIREARQDLDDTLRQRLMEVAIELASTQERIAELSLAARVGERSYATYQEAVDRLRRRRDRLERKQLNIRGWLATRDPHIAGGYRELPLEQVPSEFGTLTLPSEPEFPGPLVDQYVEALRAAFLKREQAERKMDEAARMAQDGSVPPEGIDELQSDCSAERARAEAAIAFFRGRLQQLESDYASELRVVDAQLDAARSSLQAGKTERPQFDLAERELLTVKADIGKARMMIQRALSAPGSRDVPRAKGTFLDRLAQPRAQGFPPDLFVCFLGGVLLAASVFLPMLGGLSPISAMRQSVDGAGWFVFGPLAAALAMFLSTLIPEQRIRGVAVCVGWVVVSVASVYILRTSYETQGRLGELIQMGGPWQPGLLAYFAGLISIGASVFIALMPFADYRVFAIGGLVAVILCVWGVATGFGGLLRVQPTIRVEHEPDLSQGPGIHTVRVTVGNAGWRTLALNTESREPNTYLFTLEKKIGENSWRETATPQLWEFQGTRHAVSGRSIQGLLIPRNNHVTLTYSLPAGTYRAEVRTRNVNSMPVTEEFTIDGPAEESSVPAPALPESAPVTVAPRGSTSPPSAPAHRVEVELRGTLGGDSSEPRFTIYVYKAAAEPQRMNLRVGDVLVGDWTIQEHNSELGTVTIGNGDEIRILRRGERLPIDYTPQTDTPPAESPSQPAA